MTTIYAIKSTEQFETSLFDRMLEHVPSERQKKIKRFLKWEDSQRSLIGDILSRYLICQKLDIKNTEICITHNKYGKPMLENINNLHFNISHSGDWVICGIGRNRIGVDVQQIRPIDMQIAKRYFTPQEYTSLLNQKTEDQLAFFYDLWTLKESYIKAIGMGLSLPLDSFAFHINAGIVHFSSDQAADNFSFQLYSVDNDYKLSGCIENGELPDSITILDCHELFEIFRNKYCDN